MQVITIKGSGEYMNYLIKELIDAADKAIKEERFDDLMI